MKLIICVLCVTLTGILLPGTVSSSGQEEQQKEAWKGTLRDGTEISKDKLSKTLAEIRNFVEIDDSAGSSIFGNMADMIVINLSGADLRDVNMSNAYLINANLSDTNLINANLSNANLSNANLSKANLSGANLIDANLSKANLIKADLRLADLSGADLSGAVLRGTSLGEANMHKVDLSESDLRGTDLSGANLREANLSGANLRNASLSDTDLGGADLKNANIAYANFERSIFEPVNVDEGLEFLGAKGFASIRFKKSQAVVKLRKMVKEAGFRHQERQLTAALRKRRFGTTTFRERIFENIFLDYPTDYGANPWRCLEIFGVAFVIFSIPYIVSLGKEKPDEEGIWMEWASKRMKEKMKQYEPFRLEPQGNSVFFYGMYFSLLSAFHIGWRDLNVGSWIARLQPREYLLKATGWVRVVSGVQSLISIYLLALWALTYFGRPFE